MIEQLRLQVSTSTREPAVCLVETDPKRLSESGSDENHLDRIAYVGDGNFFGHGRFRITAAVRPTSDGNARLRLTTRVEGFDAGYRNLRSTGLIERAAFDRLEEILGVAHLDP
ncbi:MAG TPA: hypothetical protein QGG47_05210 [Acidobacteriota bacterium]|nr:hypothetical protein [Acidobacteriota bacterium]